MLKNEGFNFDHSYRKLPSLFYTAILPTPVKNPELVLINHQLAHELGLVFSDKAHTELANLFSGNQLPYGADPLAQAYAGHQFGHLAMLGDGRAHLLAEHLTPKGVRVDIQLKGSGTTPYSRRGDGRAALGPMLREYIISEAMFYLGIPTTRSLAVVSTGEQVYRQTSLPGAILTRVASSHIRVGTFVYAALQSDTGYLSALLDYTVDRHYAHLNNSQNKALDFLNAVMEKQIALVINWMRVGFIHGVMNTDNMSIAGETIDYGPCAFMDRYYPNTVFSSIDVNGRYAFSNQPPVTKWNLIRLAESLLPLIDNDEQTAITLATAALNEFDNIYHRNWLAMMSAKLGLDPHADNELLITTLLNWMERNNADYTNTFLALTQYIEQINFNPNTPFSFIQANLNLDATFEEWIQQWLARIKQSKLSYQDSFKIMRHQNPAVIPRNQLVENVLTDAQQNHYQPLHDLVAILQSPYDNNADKVAYQNVDIGFSNQYQTFCGT